MKIVNVYDGKSLLACDPKSTIVYDDNGRIARKLTTIEEGKKLVEYYTYNEKGEIIRSLSENYFNGVLSHSIEESYDDEFIPVLERRIVRYYKNEKVSHVDEEAISISKKPFNGEHYDFMVQLFKEIGELDAGFVTAVRILLSNITRDTFDKFVFITQTPEDDEEDKDITYVVVNKDSGSVLTEFCESSIEIFIDDLETHISSPFVQSSMHYSKAFYDEGYEHTIITEIYDSFYKRKLIYDNDELARVETTYYYYPDHPCVYTEMDNTGAVTKRLIYHYDGTTLCKITDEYANVIEYYSYDDDYKVPNEYPIKLTEVINNDKQFKS